MTATSVKTTGLWARPWREHRPQMRTRRLFSLLNPAALGNTNKLSNERFIIIERSSRCVMHIPSKLWKCTTVSLWHWAVLPSFLLTFHETPSVDHRSYCWWKKSLHQLIWQISYFYKVLYIQRVVVWDFWSINSTCLETFQPLTNPALFLAVKL